MTGAFRLQRVLDERRRREDAAQQRVAAATLAVARAEELLRALAHAAAQQREELAAMLAGGRVDAARVVERGVALDGAVQAVRAQEAEVARRAAFLSAERDHLTAAVVERRAIERLRERHQQRVRLEGLHREALILDEIATSRAARDRAHGR